MVNTFLLNTPHLKRAKKDFSYKSDRGSLTAIKKQLERKRIDFQRLDWNINGHLPRNERYAPRNERYAGCSAEYDIEDRDNEMSQRLKEDKFIVLNSSGFFHHRSFYFVEPLEEVCYVQLDSHPDFWKRIEGRIRAGGFVQDIGRLDNVCSTYVVGVTPNEDLAPEEKSIEEIRSNVEDVNLVLSLPLEALLTGDPDKYGVDYEEVYRKAIKVYPNLTFNEKPTEFNVDELPNLPVYLSIDLDVIQMFPTVWQGHGRWNPINVLETIYDISTKREIIGADICGLDGNFLRQKSAVMKNYTWVYQYLRYVMSDRDS
jgi:hypothetical protein